MTRDLEGGLENGAVVWKRKRGVLLLMRKGREGRVEVEQGRCCISPRSEEVGGDRP